MAVGAVETLRFVAQAADADSGSEEDVLAFVGALLGGGLLGALVAAFATVFQQRAQEFRVRRIDAAEAFLSAIDETWLAVRESDVVAFITNEGLDVAGSLKATMGLDDVQAQEYQDFADEKVRLAKSRVAAEGPDAIWKNPSRKRGNLSPTRNSPTAKSRSCSVPSSYQMPQIRSYSASSG